jgi:Leu/Phe-tRNA-protein transferase
VNRCPVKIHKLKRSKWKVEVASNDENIIQRCDRTAETEVGTWTNASVFLLDFLVGMQ